MPASSIPMQTVATGILGRVTPLRFKDSIDSANREMGNRAFVRWVGAVQLMPKKRRKTPEGPKELPAQESPEASDEPDVKPATVAEVTLPREQVEQAAGSEKKKKKRKPRVQVALNTLRAEGVEAFQQYVETMIDEPELLRTLTERIDRAEDLGGVRNAALKIVSARPGAPACGAGKSLSRAVASGRGPVAQQAARAPAAASLAWKERQIFLCCMTGNAAKLKRLLMYGEYDLNVEFITATPLTIAAYRGYAAVVRELLSAPGIDVNLGQHDRGTALFFAAQQGHPEIVKMLLEDGRADINLASAAGSSPLCIAAQQGEEDVVRLLLARPEIVVDAAQYDWATPLFIACQDNRPGIVELLLERGANTGLTLDDGTSPLCAATKRGNVDVVKLLLRDAGISVDLANAAGVTPFGVACQEGHRGIAELLLRNGADPNHETVTGITPLHAASLRGRVAIVELLLNAGASKHAEVNVPAGNIYQAHELARLGGHWDIAALLEARQRRLPLPFGIESLSLEDEPESPLTPAAQARPAPTVPDRPVRPAGAAAPEAGTVTADSQPRPKPAPSPLETAKQALRQEVLGKLSDDNLESLEGIRLLEDVNRTGDIEMLCSLYNRLAHIERLKERARRSKRSDTPAPTPEAEAALSPDGRPRYALEHRHNLDADGAEEEIKQRLAPARHRFVSQAVNNMEFGRGKQTPGYPGLMHVSAGIPGVGSCSVFYVSDADGNRMRIVGIGHHLDRGTYRLEYAAGELRGRRAIRFS